MRTSHQKTANTSSAETALHPLTKPEVSASSSITASIQFIKVDGLNIAYKAIGQGKPIILLARFRGTLNDWDPAFVDAVAKSYRVILFDAPGVGRSAGVVSTSVTKWADQAVQFTHALGIEHAMYLGWSMGGAAAQIIAINHPESVDKLLLFAIIGCTRSVGLVEFLRAPQPTGCGAFCFEALQGLCQAGGVG